MRAKGDCYWKVPAMLWVTHLEENFQAIIKGTRNDVKESPESSIRPLLEFQPLTANHQSLARK